VSIQDAARRLGVSEGAVRKRVARGTLHNDKADDGRMYVYLDAGVDAGQDAGVDANNNARIPQLRSENQYLREENQRKDEIIMQQAMTMRQLTAPAEEERQEAPQSPESEASPGPSDAPTDAVGEAQEGTERLDSEARRQVPWWRRMFGG
jgi:hypothetical protein